MLRKSRSKRSKLFVDNIDLSWLLWPNRSVENDLTWILYFRHSHQKLCFFARTGVESNHRPPGSESRVLAHWAAGGEFSGGSSPWRPSPGDRPSRIHAPRAHPLVAHPPGAHPLGAHPPEAHPPEAHPPGHPSLGESFPRERARITSINGPVWGEGGTMQKLRLSF